MSGSPAARTMPTVRTVVIGRVLMLVYRTGRRIGPLLSDRCRRSIVRVGSWLAWRRGGPAVDQLRENLSGLTGGQPTEALVRAGIGSWLRNFLETFALAGWSGTQVLQRVSVRGEDALRAAVAERGAVVALPHSANWDLAGAWACLTGMPVTTVAEELTGPIATEYAEFVRLRSALGMTVISHRDPVALQKLVRAARPGQVVCLVADRDLLGAGLAVRWGSRVDAPRVTLPAGPALVARRSGAALFAMVARYTDTGIAMTIGAEIEARPGRDGLVAMTQRIADFFADRLARQPEDWHMMVPFFAVDAR